MRFNPKELANRRRILILIGESYIGLGNIMLQIDETTTYAEIEAMLNAIRQRLENISKLLGEDDERPDEQS